MSNDFIEARMRGLSPEGRRLVEEMESRLDDAPHGTPPEALFGDLGARMGALPKEDRTPLGEIIAAKISASQAQTDQDLKEKAVLERVGVLVERAERLSGREELTVGEAVGWLRDEGKLSEEEGRFAASVMGLTVEVPDQRG